MVQGTKLILQDDTLIIEADGHQREVDLYSLEGFRLLSQLWVKSGWHQRYSYTFTWMGRPIIQLPEDMIRIQELIFTLKPDVIIETGIAHGGSLIYYASLCKTLEKGRVIGVDIEIKPQNRAAIESHELFPFITLIEGDSSSPEIVSQVKTLTGSSETVLVLLDSNHTKAHVLAELNAYAPLVTPGSYIVATDGIMQDLAGSPQAGQDWDWNNPQQAAQEFAQQNPNFILETPPFLFNESGNSERITYWPQAYLKRVGK
jgi:cephalosporin hydroxylase